MEDGEPPPAEGLSGSARSTRLQFSAEMFNLFNFDNVIIGPADNNNTNTIYGLGVNPDDRYPQRTAAISDVIRPDVHAPEASRRTLRC